MLYQKKMCFTHDKRLKKSPQNVYQRGSNTHKIYVSLSTSPMCSSHQHINMPQRHHATTINNLLLRGHFLARRLPRGDHFLRTFLQAAITTNKKNSKIIELFQNASWIGKGTPTCLLIDRNLTNLKKPNY